MNDEHPYGSPFSRATYGNGCRCELCKEANSKYMKERRQDKTSSVVYHSKAQSIAAAHAAQWVRHNHPDIWEQLLKEAKRRVRAAEST